MLDIDTLLKKTFLAHVEHHTSLGSTNDRGRDCPVGENQLGHHETPRLIVADTQTAGRGRDQTSWWTDSDALAFSLVLDGQPFRSDLRQRAMIALVAGIAVTEVVKGRGEKRGERKEEVGELRVGIHWPNDVFVDGRKICGILVEVPSDGRIIIGIGINTNNRVADAPVELANRVTTLRDLTGQEHDHTELLVEILNQFEKWLDVLLEDSSQVGQRADELCLQHDKQLSIDPGDGQIVSGRCLGIGSDGAILLETVDGPQSLYSGRLV